jgi:hypothetical protein
VGEHAAPRGSSSGGQRAFTIAGEQAPEDDSGGPWPTQQIVSHSYFTALDLSVVDGRALRRPRHP